VSGIIFEGLKGGQKGELCLIEGLLVLVFCIYNYVVRTYVNTNKQGKEDVMKGPIIPIDRG